MNLTFAEDFSTRQRPRNSNTGEVTRDTNRQSEMVSSQQYDPIVPMMPHGLQQTANQWCSRHGNTSAGIENESFSSHRSQRHHIVPSRYRTGADDLRNNHNLHSGAASWAGSHRSCKGHCEDAEVELRSDSSADLALFLENEVSNTTRTAIPCQTMHVAQNINHESLLFNNSKRKHFYPTPGRRKLVGLNPAIPGRLLTDCSTSNMPKLGTSPVFQHSFYQSAENQNDNNIQVSSPYHQRYDKTLYSESRPPSLWSGYMPDSPDTSDSNTNENRDSLIARENEALHESFSSLDSNRVNICGKCREQMNNLHSTSTQCIFGSSTIAKNDSHSSLLNLQFHGHPPPCVTINHTGTEDGSTVDSNHLLNVLSTEHLKVSMF